MTQFSKEEDYARNFFVEGYPPTAGNTATLKTNFTIKPSAPFAELMVLWQFTAGPSQNETIMCLAVLIEQPDEQVNTAVSYLPLALAAYSGLVSLVSTFMRASVGNGLLGATATYGLVTEPVNVHSPGFFDIIFYAQFMLMTGQLSLNYPSFYSTFTSLFHWSFLEFRNSFAGRGPDNSTEVLTYGGAGSVNIIKDTAYQNQNQNQNKRSLHELFVDPPADAIEVPTPIAYATPKVTVADHVAPYKINKRQVQETTDATGTPVTPVTKTPSSSAPPTSMLPSSVTSSSSTTKTTKTKTSTTAATSTTSTITTTSTPTSTPSPIIPLVKNPFDKNSNIETKRYNVSRFGIEAYAAAIGADPSDLFLCTFINTVLAGGASLFLSAFYLVIAWVKAKESHQKGKALQHAFNFVAGKSRISDQTRELFQGESEC
ncbi:hypothetical protein BG000_010350 [Podila horticola]|nr:hypothetical protein BG000_010350 [Podila horticola]